MIECKDCGREFSEKRLLKRHINRIHNPDYKPPEPKECSICGKFYSNVNQHIKRNHSTNPDHIEEIKRSKAIQKLYYLNNKETILKRSIEWNDTHRERNRELKRQWARRNSHLKLNQQASYNEPIECDKCGKIVIKRNINRHKKGIRCKEGKKIYTPQAKKKSEMEKLRERIKLAEKNKTINKNLVIKEDVILVF